MRAPVAVLACGNPSRGDDAIGPLLLARLGDWLAAEGIAERFELIEDFQFQIEHALDLQGRQAALFIDAGIDTPAPYSLAHLPPPAGDLAPLAHCSHALTPRAVLAICRRVTGEAPPSAWVLCVRGESFGLGEAPGAAALAHMAAAWPALQRWCRDFRAAGSGS